MTILCNKVTGQPKGFAYVEFLSTDAVANALAFDGTLFKGRQLKVAKHHGADGDSGRGRGRGRGGYRGRGRGRWRGRGGYRGRGRGRYRGRGGYRRYNSHY